MSTFARINYFGFLESPYRKVVDGKPTDEIDFLSADEEDKYIIAQANEPLDENGYFANEYLIAKYRGKILEVAADRVHYMDVSQTVGRGFCFLIPFLENDDANRALMGPTCNGRQYPY